MVTVMRTRAVAAPPLAAGAGRAPLQPRHLHRTGPLRLRIALTRESCLPHGPAGRPPAAAAQPGEPAPQWEPPAAPPADSLSSVEEDSPLPVIKGHRISLQDLYYYINVVYWTLLLASVFSGHPLLERASHFGNFAAAMFLCSAACAAYFAIRWALDARQHLATAERRDAAALMRYAFNTSLWLGFVLWYASPVAENVVDWTATAGAIMCLYGAVLAASAALTAGMWSFLGSPQIPRRLATGGPYALLRHPQALGNMLFLVGFSLAGGALWASAAFVLAFFIYRRTVLPKEEAMLEKRFGDKYRHYKERVPPFAWALVLLLIVEAALIWRFAPYSLPVGPVLRPPML